MEVAHGIDATLKSKEVSLFHNAFVLWSKIFFYQLVRWYATRRCITRTEYDSSSSSALREIKRSLILACSHSLFSRLLDRANSSGYCQAWVEYADFRIVHDSAVTERKINYTISTNRPFTQICMRPPVRTTIKNLFWSHSRALRALSA